MARQEQGVEAYETGGGERRYRVRWREGGRHRSKSFRRLTGPNGARAFYQRTRVLLESGGRARREAGELTLAAFAAEVWAPRARHRLAEKTWSTVSQIYNAHVLEQL